MFSSCFLSSAKNNNEIEAAKIRFQELVKDPERTYKERSSSHLIRAFVLLKLCSNDYFAQHAYSVCTKNIIDMLNRKMLPKAVICVN